jgi:hypothetical protein
MSGLEECNRRSFFKMETKLILYYDDVVVLNPATIPTGLAQGNYMDICFAMLRSANCIVMLPGYENSKGALAELAYAEKLGMKVFKDNL